MINFEQISIMLQLEVFQEDNKFSIEQRDKLIYICEQISKLNNEKLNAVKKIQKYKILEKKYNEEHFLFGGNVVRLNQKYRDFELSGIPYLKELSEKLTKLRGKI